jgi:hypothetical protein
LRPDNCAASSEKWISFLASGAFAAGSGEKMFLGGTTRHEHGWRVVVVVDHEDEDDDEEERLSGARAGRLVGLDSGAVAAEEVVAVAVWFGLLVGLLALGGCQWHLSPFQRSTMDARTGRFL